MFKTIIISDPFTGEPYLQRTVFLKTRLLTIYGHKFLKKDEDRHLHSHPWWCSASIVLTGSYTEQRKGRGAKRVRLFNLFTKNTCHRISELHGTVRSLFIGGPRTQDWGFLVKGEIIPHLKYFELCKSDEIGLKRRNK